MNIHWVLFVLCHENVGACIWCSFSAIKEMNNVSIKAASIKLPQISVLQVTAQLWKDSFLGTM